MRFRNRKPDLYTVDPSDLSADGRPRLERIEPNPRLGQEIMVNYFNDHTYGIDAYDGSWSATVTGYDNDSSPLASFETWGEHPAGGGS
jgi:hypothetical protein